MLFKGINLSSRLVNLVTVLILTVFYLFYNRSHKYEFMIILVFTVGKKALGQMA